MSVVPDSRRDSKLSLNSQTEDYAHAERIRVLTALKTLDPQSHSRWVVSASNTWRVAWDLGIILLAIYNAIMEPLCIGFALDEQHESVRFLSYIVDAAFVLDIILTLFTSIELDTGEEVFDLAVVRRKYLTSLNFLIDLLSVFPFDLIISGVVATESNTRMGMLKLFKMFRLLRLRKVSALHGFTKLFKLHFKLLLVIFYLFLYVHLAACFWSSITSGDSDWFPPKDYGRETTYHNEEDIGQRYSTALYYGTLMLLGADAYPRGELGMLFASGVSLLGAVAVAVLFGNMTVLMDSLRTKMKLFSEEVDTANHVMASLNISSKLQSRVLSYLSRTFQVKDRQQELNKFLLVISPSLKLQLSQFLFISALRSNPVFMNRQTLTECLVRFVRIDGCNPEAALVQQGQHGKLMYILAIGEVSVTVRNLEGVERVVRKLRPGDYFGEVALLTDSPRSATVKSLNFCTYATLSITHLNDLIAKFPSLRESLLQHIIQEYKDEQRTLVVERMSQLPFIAALPETDRILLFYAMRPSSASKMQSIRSRGDSNSGLVVVVSGTLGVQATLQRREWVSVLIRLPAGSLCFCTTFLTGKPLVMDVVALKPTALYQLEKTGLEALLKRHPKAELALTKFQEKLENDQNSSLDFMLPQPLHRQKKDLLKLLRLKSLALCQYAYARRRAEMAIRVSTLMGVLKSYLAAHMPSTPADAKFDCQAELQTIVEATIHLAKRVELLTLECARVSRRQTKVSSA